MTQQLRQAMVSHFDNLIYKKQKELYHININLAEVTKAKKEKEALIETYTKTVYMFKNEFNNVE